MKFNQLRTDKKRDAEGAWVDIGEGASILVGRIEGRRYRDMRDKLLRKHQIQLQTQSLGTDILEQINLEVEAETILLGFKGFEDDDGKDIKFSKKKGLEMLTESDIFRSIVLRAGNDLNNFRRGDKARAKDALEKNSDGASSTEATAPQ